MTQRASNEQAATFFATLTDKEIRRRQNLAEQQIARAYEMRHTDALERLQLTHNLLTAEMLNRC